MPGDIGNSSKMPASAGPAPSMPAPQSANDHIEFQTIDQEDLQRAVVSKFNEQENERDASKITLAERRIETLTREVAEAKAQLANCEESEKKKYKRSLVIAEAQLQKSKDEVKATHARIEKRQAPAAKAGVPTAAVRQPHETRRAFLIRTGKITPFDKVSENSDDDEEAPQEPSHQKLSMPGFTRVPEKQTSAKRRRSNKSTSIKAHNQATDDVDENDEEYEDASDNEPSDDDIDDDEEEATPQSKGKGKRRADTPPRQEKSAKKSDDGNEQLYQVRKKLWLKERRAARLAAGWTLDPSVEFDADDSEENLEHPTIEDHVISEDLRIPGDIHPSLFGYQRTCIKWLWQLHEKEVGGILADEMGLGKTVQIISFLASLLYSEKYGAPSIIVVPVTVLSQWVEEFHKWWPVMRVAILHASGSGMQNLRKEATRRKVSNSQADFEIAEELVDRVFANGHVLVTSYSGLQKYGEILLNKEWGYAILDEGHQIRNPDAAITLACKRLKTKHRIILSGTPMQNNLPELWSMMDFAHPGHLGRLPDFIESFSGPIRAGTFSGASHLEVKTSYECALLLKKEVEPFILRRTKADVATELPSKREQVIFCKLTTEQREMYRSFLNGEGMRSILAGRQQILWGIDIVRKICNHPDLPERVKLLADEDYEYGNPSKSGKMEILRALLPYWRNEGHRTLLFCQTVQVLDILEKLVKAMGMTYRRMDGKTVIKNRHKMIDEFNDTTSIDVFLLTTKVGGLGVNLTGADRVIIFDPHWNPSTDMQARERAWRLGQKKQVVIYRLLMAGTIEEKIYHRQIFKQFLSDKVLTDPRQNQFFKSKDLHDLFSLTEATATLGTETGKLFKGVEQFPLGAKDTEDDKLRELDGVASFEDFQEEDSSDEESGPSSGAGPSSKGESSKRKGKKEEGLLEQILSRSGVHSSLEHDAIMGSNKNRLKYEQEEAMNVAHAARAALEHSRANVGTQEPGALTWTGRSGDLPDANETPLELPVEKPYPPYLTFWPAYKEEVDRQIEVNREAGRILEEGPDLGVLPAHRTPYSFLDSAVFRYEKLWLSRRFQCAYVKYDTQHRPGRLPVEDCWKFGKNGGKSDGGKSKKAGATDNGESSTSTSAGPSDDIPIHPGDLLFNISPRDANKGEYKLIAKIRRYLASREGRASRHVCQILFQRDINLMVKKHPGFLELLDDYIPKYPSDAGKRFWLLWPDDPLREKVGSQVDIDYERAYISNPLGLEKLRADAAKAAGEAAPTGSSTQTTAPSTGYRTVPARQLPTTPIQSDAPNSNTAPSENAPTQSAPRRVPRKRFQRFEEFKIDPECEVTKVKRKKTAADNAPGEAVTSSEQSASGGPVGTPENGASASESAGRTPAGRIPVRRAPKPLDNEEGGANKPICLDDD
ncbi:SNF2 family N-terminal domain-containing protein [Peziza echinospora]|nr:SNF2 family N-terminal domain-containing protein [Peziza echinospora]